MSKCERSGVAGFTLIELLAVVAIILLLVSLLAPAFKGVRDQASLVMCQSNVRQVNLGIINYTGDNGGMLMGPNWVDTPAGRDTQQKGWLCNTLGTGQGGLGYGDLSILQSGLAWLCRLGKSFSLSRRPAAKTGRSAVVSEQHVLSHQL